MTKEIITRIQNELARIEQTEGITILYACESGSRAWGFESADSDYDVRFIYLRRTDWYLTIRKSRRDVIEIPIEDNMDISGWDLPKTLQLFQKSNPPLLEKLQSPIVYARTSSLVDRLRQLMNDYYSPIACMYHYLHMAEGNFRSYLKEREVWTKKYFYVLRPVLACIWIERGCGVVPMEFKKLVEAVVDDADVKQEIESLIAEKLSGVELDRGPRRPVISEYLEAELSRLRAEALPPPRTNDPADLDRLFIDILKEVNGMSIEPAASGCA